MGGTWIIQAPSKINLHLRVGDRRSNGYHELESLFLCLEFGDTLWFEIRKPDYGDSACSIGLAEGIEPSWVDALVGERNIITQAAALFRERTGFDKSVQVRLKKRIPLGGGMGGGSSNAASTLAALNVLAGADLSQAVLHEMAVTLGSDVPFFLSGGGVALVSGCGNIVQPIQTFGRAPLYADAPFWVVLVNPGFSSDTEAAYVLLDEARRLGVVKPPGRPAEGAVLVEALEKHPAFWPYENDFLPVFLAPGPNGETTPAGKVYRDILAELRGLKADFWGLSGAGSTCFGIFSHKGVAEQAVRSLLTRYRFVELTIPLAHSVKAVLQ